MCVLGLATVLQLALIMHSLDRPLWFDEAWRADFIDRNFHIPISQRAGYAVISLGSYLVTKFFVLFSDDNFTQRLLVYISTVALPFAVYYFCKMFFDKRTAQIMVPITVLAGYILEFSTQNKPYLLDIIVMLLLFMAQHQYSKGKLKLTSFILVSVMAILFSFTAIIVVGFLGIYMATSLWLKRRKLKGREIKDFALWAIIVGLVTIIYYVLFLKPQTTPQLYSYYGGFNSSLYPTGGIIHIFYLTLVNVLEMFGIIIGSKVLDGGTEPNHVLWTNIQTVVNNKPVMGLSLILSLFYIGLFIYGMYWLKREKKNLIFYSVIGIYGLEWITGLMKEWPFGNSRTNLFSLFLITLVLVCGGIKLAELVLRGRYRLLVPSLIIVILVLVLPYRTVAAGLYGDKSTFIVDGQGMYSYTQQVTMFIAAKSKTSDHVYISGAVGPFGFDYFYNHYSPGRKYAKTEAKNIHNVNYSTSKLQAIQSNLNKYLKNGYKTVWLADAAAYRWMDTTTISKDSYRVVHTYIVYGGTNGNGAVLKLEHY
jgi:hypothetical protein